MAFFGDIEEKIAKIRSVISDDIDKNTDLISSGTIADERTIYLDALDGESTMLSFQDFKTALLNAIDVEIHEETKSNEEEGGKTGANVQSKRLPLRQRKIPGRKRERFRSSMDELKKHVLELQGGSCDCSAYSHAFQPSWKCLGLLTGGAGCRCKNLEDPRLHVEQAARFWAHHNAMLSTTERAARALGVATFKPEEIGQTSGAHASAAKVATARAANREAEKRRLAPQSHFLNKRSEILLRRQTERAKKERKRQEQEEKEFENEGCLADDNVKNDESSVLLDSGDGKNKIAGQKIEKSKELGLHDWSFSDIDPQCKTVGEKDDGDAIDDDHAVVDDLMEVLDKFDDQNADLKDPIVSQPVVPRPKPQWDNGSPRPPRQPTLRWPFSNRANDRTCVVVEGYQEKKQHAWRGWVPLELPLDGATAVDEKGIDDKMADEEQAKGFTWIPFSPQMQ